MTLAASTCGLILREKPMTNPFSRQPATADYSIRKGDTGPAIEAQLTNVDGSTVDLTDASEVRLYIRRQADGEDVVNTAIAIDDAADGQVSHEFDNGFSSTGDGMHSLYFEVQFSSGSIESYPRGGVAYLWVPERFSDGDLADLDPQNAEVGVLTADDLYANTIAGRGGPLQWSTDQDANGNDLTGLGAVGATTLSPGSLSEQIGTTQLSNEAVTAAKIAAAAVESGAIKSGAVGSDAIATDAVGSDAIASDAVTVAELAAALGTDENNKIPGTTHFENSKHEALEAESVSTDDSTINQSYTDPTGYTQDRKLVGAKPIPTPTAYMSGPAHGEGGTAFQGATLAPDGRVVFAPRDSSNVGIFDPSDGSYTSGPTHGEGGLAFFGATLAPDGRVVFAPFNSSNVGIFDPSDGSYTSGPAHGEGGAAFIGAMLAPDGRVVFAPRDSSNVGIFDPSDNSYTSGPAHGEGGAAFTGATLSPDGRVVFAPRDSSNVGIFDPSDNSYTSGPAHGEGGAAFFGATLAPDGRVVFAPFGSSNVGIFDPSDGSYTSGPAHGEGSSAFIGATLSPDGRVVFAPFNSSNVGITSQLLDFAVANGGNK